MRSIVPLLCALVLVNAAPAAAAAPAAGDFKRVCVVTGPRPDAGAAFGALVGRPMDCVLTYNDAAPDWASWERPWFLKYPSATFNWGSWNSEPGTNRRVIISQNLFPASVNTTDWRQAGADGAFVDHARALAQNLVAGGLGNAVIRLAHEANGDWYPDSIGTTDRDYALWREFWRKTVIAMRSVAGADFTFDWCVNAAYRPVAFDKYYPGDDVVDVIGIDAYDSGIRQQNDRWPIVYGRPYGVRDLVAFAAAHGKPLSIPEWGVAPASTALSGGDDPSYVDGIASVVRDNPVAYHAYYYAHAWADQLAEGTASLAAYRRHFGPGGDSVAGSVATTAPETAGVAAPSGETGVGPAPAQTRPAAHKPRPAAKRKPRAKARRHHKRRRAAKRRRTAHHIKHRRS